MEDENNGKRNKEDAVLPACYLAGCGSSPFPAGPLRQVNPDPIGFQNRITLMKLLPGTSQLIAGGVSAWPVLLYVLLALLAVEIVILFFIPKGHS